MGKNSWHLVHLRSENARHVVQRVRCITPRLHAGHMLTMSTQTAPEPATEQTTACQGDGEATCGKRWTHTTLRTTLKLTGLALLLVMNSLNSSSVLSPCMWGPICCTGTGLAAGCITSQAQWFDCEWASGRWRSSCVFQSLTCFHASPAVVTCIGGTNGRPGGHSSGSAMAGPCKQLLAMPIQRVETWTFKRQVPHRCLLVGHEIDRFAVQMPFRSV